jgi:hypothetical protein
VTIPRYLALQAHWRRHPRPEWLIAGYLGFKPPPEAPQSSMTRPTVAQRQKVPPPTGALMSLFQSLGGKPGKPGVVAL